MNTPRMLSALAFPLSLLPLGCGSSHGDQPSPAALTSASAANASARPTPFEVSQGALRPAGSAYVSPASFQGEILVAVKADPSRKLPASITYEERGEKIRYTPASSHLSAVADLETQRVYAIDDTSKTYESIDMKAPTGAKPTTTVKIQKDGTIDKVAGFECENWTIDDGVERADVCAWNGAAYVDLASNAKPGSSETEWAAALTAERMFPLRVVVHDETGKELYRAEATKVTPTVVNESTFAVPSGYHKADLGNETLTASLP